MSSEVFGSGVSVMARPVAGDPYITIGCASSCSWQFINELIGKTDVNAGLFKKKRKRISDCTGSVDGVIITENSSTRLSIFHFLQEAIRGSEIDMQFVFEDVSGGVKVIQGMFIISSADLSADVSAWAEFTLNLEGTGNISITDVLPPDGGFCENIQSDWWETVPGESGISGPGHAGLSFAGHDVIEVERTGLGHDIITTGTPGNREAKYDGGVSITFDPTNVFNPDERIFVIWVEDAS